MKDNSSIEETIKNIKEIISVYGTVVDELIVELEKNNSICEGFKNENETLKEKNKELEKKLLEKTAELKQEKNKKKQDIDDLDKIYFKFQRLLKDTKDFIEKKEGNNEESSGELTSQETIKDIDLTEENTHDDNESE